MWQMFFIGLTKSSNLLGSLRFIFDGDEPAHQEINLHCNEGLSLEWKMFLSKVHGADSGRCNKIRNESRFC